MSHACAHAQTYIYTDLCTVYSICTVRTDGLYTYMSLYISMYTYMSEICKSGRIVVDIDTIVILFMRARSVLAIEIKCLLLCGMFTLEIIQFVNQPPTQLYCSG